MKKKNYIYIYIYIYIYTHINIHIHKPIHKMLSISGMVYCVSGML